MKPTNVAIDCLVDRTDIEIIANGRLVSGADLEADLDSDNAVDFKDYAFLADAWLDERLWPQFRLVEP